MSRTAHEAVREAGTHLPVLVCLLDHRMCDTKCPSCRGDYAIPPPKRHVREEPKRYARDAR